MSKADKSGEQGGRRISFNEFAAKVQARRETLSDQLSIPRNDGARRTASKRALLKAINATGANW